MKLIDRVKFAIGAPCANINTAWDNTTYALGDYVHMIYHNQLTIVLVGGAASGAASAVTVKQATTAAGGSAKNVTLDYVWVNTATSAASDTWTRTAVTSNTFTPTTTTANLSYILEIHVSQLDLANSFEFVAINIAGGGGGTNYYSCLYILSDPRYVSAASVGQTGNLTVLS